MKATVEMCQMLKAENTKLKQKLEEQTKTYQKILQEQQAEIDNLQRNCDVFNEQMNNAVEITAKLKQEKKELIEWLNMQIDFLERTFGVKNKRDVTNEHYTMVQTYKYVLERLGE